MIRDLILNFIKKYKELDAELKRKKVRYPQSVMNCEYDSDGESIYC